MLYAGDEHLERLRETGARAGHDLTGLLDAQGVAAARLTATAARLAAINLALGEEPEPPSAPPAVSVGTVRQLGWQPASD